MTTTHRARLERRRREILRSLTPPETILRGSVFVRHRRCGGVTCWCAKDKKGHATAYISTTFADGHTEQISLPPELVAEARRWVATYRRCLRDIERICAINRELFRKRWIGKNLPE